MKKYTRILGISVLCLGLALTAPMSVWAASATEDQAEENQTTDWVFDEYGLLSGEEKEELNQELADIYEKYEYDAILLISQDIESDDARQYAAEFMQDNKIGYGDTHEGMCIFNQPDKRNITIVFRGDTQNDFTETIQDLMLDNCQEKLKEGDMIGGYKSLISDLKKTLSEADAEHVILKSRNTIAIDRDAVDCDYYDFLRHIPYAVNCYQGEYMVQYSWAELTIATLSETI